jgi:hypothetical protein
MVAAVVGGVFLFLLASTAAYDLCQRRRGRRVMGGAQSPSWDALRRPEAYLPHGGMGTDGSGGAS